MTFQIENETDEVFPFDLNNVIRDVILTSLDEEGCPYEAEVSVTVTDDDGIREINLQNRSIDAPTDVLSFPMISFGKPADFVALDDDSDAFNPDTGELLLGDIVLNADRIRSQAKLYGHSEKREAAFLTAHSMLHLMGYDHEEENERLEMEEKQESILRLLGITRESD
ncbi:MAG: rRNA maturation RNase YbeY [Lachnospiraceae bacterium]|nr:rRNA maturation RNase YbeY [Lachnospiraceae bacterium]